MKLAVVCGLTEEANIVRSVLGSGAMIYCGAAGLAKLSSAPTTLTHVLSWGVCGGLAPVAKLHVGDTLIASAVLTDGDVYPVNGDWYYRLSDAFGTTAKVGAFYSGKEAADTPDQRAALFAKTKAWAIDDESLAAARMARERNIALAVLRTVSDDALATIPRAALAATNADGSSNIPAILAALHADPPEWLEMPEVEWNFGVAVQRLWDAARRARPSFQAQS